MKSNTEYEKFIAYFSPNKIFEYILGDIRLHKMNGQLGLAIVTFIGFALYFISLFFKGWLFGVFIAAGTPLLAVWSIWVMRNPGGSTFKNNINSFLEQKQKNGDLEDLANYLATRYVFETSSFSWRTGFAVAWTSLGVGHLLGFIGSNSAELNKIFTSVFLQGAIGLLAFAFLLSVVAVLRKDQLAMAIKEVKKFMR